MCRQLYNSLITEREALAPINHRGSKVIIIGLMSRFSHQFIISPNKCHSLSALISEIYYKIIVINFYLLECDIFSAILRFLK